MRLTRFFSVLTFFSLVFPFFLVICSVGCRMCGPQYDYCMPAYTGRTEDYRGCNPLYRAGSIFNCYGDAVVDDEGQIIRATNAGNFGTITPMGRVHSVPSRLEPRSETPIGKPSLAPTSNGNNNIEDPENTLPGIEDLLQERTPVKPAIPTVNPPITRQVPAETIPFSAQSGEPTFTIEDLRRLDPSVTDIKILNIEDSVNAK